MTWWNVDVRDRVAQRVTVDTEPPPSEGGRFWKVEADDAEQAINKVAYEGTVNTISRYMSSMALDMAILLSGRWLEVTPLPFENIRVRVKNEPGARLILDKLLSSYPPNPED